MTRITAEQMEARFLAAQEVVVPGHGAVRRRLLPDSTLDVFTEIRLPTGDWALVVDCDQQLDDRDVLLARGLTCRSRSGSIEVVAAPSTDKGLFCTLLADLVQHLLLVTGDPPAALVSRILAWQRMLGRGLPTGLSVEARIGLFGELLVLIEVLLPVVGDEAAIRAWVGPSGAAQDFLTESVAVEVKTVSYRDPDRCRISDERQLDGSGLDRLFLVHQVLRGSPDGVSLSELVDALREELSPGRHLLLFENRLLDAGWLDSHREQYGQDRYVLSRRQCFVVDERFPRLTPRDLPDGVTRTSYLVDLSVCAVNRVDESVVGAVLNEYPVSGSEATGV